MSNKRSELASILRRLADYVDNHWDDELAPIFEQATALGQATGQQKRHRGQPPKGIDSERMKEIEEELHRLRSREDGERLLQNEAPNRPALESLARFFQLPVQKDDTIERLRAKIIENTIGSRLRSKAIQGEL